MPRPICCALLFALISGVLSCTSNRVENPWLNPRPEDVRSQRWQEVPPQRVREVSGDTLAEAVRMLESEAAVRLPGRDVQRFVPGDVFGQPMGRFYLVRAVRTGGQDGSYEVLTTGRAIAVRFSALSPGAGTAQSAVVVDLLQAPDAVYVEVAVAR